jgi:hypothetical protein
MYRCLDEPAPAVFAVKGGQTWGRGEALKEVKWVILEFLLATVIYDQVHLQEMHVVHERC